MFILILMLLPTTIKSHKSDKELDNLQWFIDDMQIHLKNSDQESEDRSLSIVKGGLASLISAGSFALGSAALYCATAAVTEGSQTFKHSCNNLYRRTASKERCYTVAVFSYLISYFSGKYAYNKLLKKKANIKI